LNLAEYQSLNDKVLSFTREQSSRFAKQVAGDFNPLHDTDSRRFCVPGDLLFVSLLDRYGLAAVTSVEFAGMVDEDITFELPDTIGRNFDLVGHNDNRYLSFATDGERIPSNTCIAALAQRYVEFSGLAFPDILVPLMQSREVMINPARPLVIYKSMKIELTPEGVDFFSVTDADSDSAGVLDNLALERSDSTLDVQGRKGEVALRFIIKSNNMLLGGGVKEMILGGLRPYEQSTVDDVVKQYNEWKQCKR